MGKSKIQWLHAEGYKPETLNIFTGCTKISAGCANCYAERLFPRVYGQDFVQSNFNTGINGKRPRKFTDVRFHPERLLNPYAWQMPRFCFINSMSDLFHEQIDFSDILKVFDMILENQNHKFIILTKRIYRAIQFFKYLEAARPFTGSNIGALTMNLIFGVSIENQLTTVQRMPVLQKIPILKKVVSIEPLIDAVNISPYLKDPTIEWVLIGAESGSKKRPCKGRWINHLIDQCLDVVPVFVKQVHKWDKDSFELTKDINNFPEVQRVQQFPDFLK